MRVLSGAVLGLLGGLCAIGCDAPTEQIHGKPNAVAASSTAPNAPTSGAASTFKVTGHLTGDGNGSTALGTGGPNLPSAATSVDVMAMDKDGALTTVATAPVTSATFSADVPAGSSPTQIFIIKAKDATGAVVGSSVINGFLDGAFFKAFLVDAPMDTETSFKAEILDTIAKKGVPGIQNYLNVVDTYVNAQLTNSLTVDSAFTADIVNITNATSDAIIAGEDVIESTLKSAGIPIDFSALQKVQVAAVSGFDNTVMSLEGKEMTSAENFFQALEAATAKAVKPADQAIFNAVVSSSGAMSHSMKQSKTSDALQFSATKSGFQMQSALAARSINRLFPQANASDAIQTGATAFLGAVDAASTVEDLTAAQTSFANVLLSKNTSSQSGGLLSCLVGAVVSDIHAICTAIESCVAPCLAKLTGVYATATSGTSYDAAAVGKALTDFDAAMAAPPAQMNGAMSSADASALMQAVGMVEKQGAL